MSYCWNILPSASSDPSGKLLSMQCAIRSEDGDFTGPKGQDGWLFLCLACQHMLLGVAEFSLRSAFILTYYLGSRYKPSTTSNSSVSNCLPLSTMKDQIARIRSLNLLSERLRDLIKVTELVNIRVKFRM